MGPCCTLAEAPRAQPAWWTAGEGGAGAGPQVRAAGLRGGGPGQMSRQGCDSWGWVTAGGTSGASCITRHCAAGETEVIDVPKVSKPVCGGGSGGGGGCSCWDPSPGTLGRREEEMGVWWCSMLVSAAQRVPPCGPHSVTHSWPPAQSHLDRDPVALWPLWSASASPELPAGRARLFTPAPSWPWGERWRQRRGGGSHGALVRQA